MLRDFAAAGRSRYVALCYFSVAGCDVQGRIGQSTRNFNLDHVVLSTRGFFVIETKTHSKPKRGRAEVSFTENSVRVAGYTPNRDPVAQVQAESRWLGQLFEKSTGRPAFPIKGVVVYPGWTVQRMSTAWKRSADLPWVLPPDGSIA